MSIIQSILLGTLQGLTEFLPVSSSGHLVILENIFKLQTNLAFIVLLHLATLLAVIVYFRKDVLDILLSFLRGVWLRICCRATLRTLYYSDTRFKMAVLLLLGTIVTGAIGFTFKDTFESLFS